MATTVITDSFALDIDANVVHPDKLVEMNGNKGGKDDANRTLGLFSQGSLSS
jgi:hypothetical protein